MNLPHATVQTIAAVLALCISVAAALFAWEQVEVSRLHNRLSVAPILHVTPHAEGKSGRNGLYISNVGLGPALLKAFKVSSGSEVAQGFESDRWVELLAAADINPACFATGWPRSDTAIKAGDELPLIFLTKSEGVDGCYGELVKLIGGNGVDISITYESVYGEQKKILGSSKINSKSAEKLYQQLFVK
jgi:hypothetical protein